MAFIIIPFLFKIEDYSLTHLSARHEFLELYYFCLVLDLKDSNNNIINNKGELKPTKIQQKIDSNLMYSVSTSSSTEVGLELGWIKDQTSL